jgi:hypothetical protein
MSSCQGILTAAFRAVEGNKLMLKKIIVTEFVVVYDDEKMTGEDALSKEINANGLLDHECHIEDVKSIDDLPDSWKASIPWGSNKPCRVLLTAVLEAEHDKKKEG